jgi:predicted PurR-regulated permease PerM
MSQGVELHPLLVIFGVFAGGDIGGAAGVFLAVPVLALTRLVLIPAQAGQGLGTRPVAGRINPEKRLKRDGS